MYIISERDSSYFCIKFVCIKSLSIRDENSEFENNVDLDEVAHNEPPHLDLHCLPHSL